MSRFNGKLVVPSLIGLTLLLVGGGYAMGRKSINPFHSTASALPPDDSSSLAKAMHNRCGKLAGENKIDCYSKTLDSLASAGEVKLAMGTLSRLATLDLDTKRDGHVYAHGIGIAAGKRGGDVAKTFSMCDESNQSGCYHGVIQAYFDAAKTIGPKEVNALCEPFRGANGDRWLRFQCVHGMGHGLTMIYAHDLPMALKGCDLLTDDWDRLSCYGGAFMENIVNVTNPHHPAHGLGEHTSMHMEGMAGMEGMNRGGQPFKAIDPKDPLYPCSIMADRYLESCYEMQTSIILYLNHGDMAATAKTCDKAPGYMKFVCYQSLGRDISSYSLQDHPTAIRMCSLGAKKYQPWCYIGLVKNFIDLNARPADGLALCKELKAPPSKTKCYEAVGEQIATLRNDIPSRRTECSAAEETYVDICLFGARVVSEIPPLLKEVNRDAYGGLN
jgi:hypothetical protein